MNNRIYLAAFLLICFFTQYLFSQENADTLAVDYKTEIENHRKGINIKFMYSESSPFTQEQKKQFNGLNYFPVDSKYEVEGTLIKEPEQETIIMKTSTDRTPEYVKYGKVSFEIDTMKLTLTVYQNKKLLEISKDKSHLFIPFRDKTSGELTYGGGRYIDSNIPDEGDKIILDFNKTYNPFCAYNHKYSCVIPPEENRLPLRIEAGEKNYDE